MKFNDLVNMVLESGKGTDPLKYVATGPMGFRKDSGIANPEKPVAIDKGPADQGVYIAADARRLIAMAFGVAMSDTKAGMSLKNILETYGKLHLTHNLSKKEVQVAQNRYDKLPNKESELAISLAQRIKEYTRQAEEYYRANQIKKLNH
jgi:hypothetical protein